MVCFFLPALIEKNGMKGISYEEVNGEVLRYRCILEIAYELLEKEFRQANIPAQKEGLWQHHVSPDGLYRHSLEVGQIASQIVNADENMSLFLNVIALAHDYGKLYGKTDKDHAYWSLKLFEEKFIPRLKEEFLKRYPDQKELFQSFLNSNIYLIMREVIRWHHFPFENSAKVNPQYLPWVLLFVASDFASISRDLIGINEETFQSIKKKSGRGKKILKI